MDGRNLYLFERLRERTEQFPKRNYRSEKGKGGNTCLSVAIEKLRGQIDNGKPIFQAGEKESIRVLKIQRKGPGSLRTEEGRGEQTGPHQGTPGLRRDTKKTTLEL